VCFILCLLSNDVFSCEKCRFQLCCYVVFQLCLFALIMADAGIMSRALWRSVAPIAPAANYRILDARANVRAKVRVSINAVTLIRFSVRQTDAEHCKIGNWNFRTRELSSQERKFHRWNFRFLELSFSGTLVLNIKISMELSFPNINY